MIHLRTAHKILHLEKAAGAGLVAGALLCVEKEHAVECVDTYRLAAALGATEESGWEVVL
jgi:hypothetical protein